MTEESPETLARRTAKQWRHEDRELTSTHTLCRFVFMIQAAIIPVSGLFIRDSATHRQKFIFISIVALAFLSMIGICVFTYLLVRYDRFSAWYYGITSRGRADYPPDFQKTKEEDKRKAKKADFDRWRPRLEIVQVITFILTVALFLCLII